MRGSVQLLTPICAVVTLLGIVGCSDGGDVTAPDGAVLAAASGNGSANAARAAEQLYEVTIENLMTSQPFSPGVFATHTKQVSLFEVGSYASEGIRLIAEQGNPSVAAAELMGKPGVHDVVTTSAPVHRIGGPGPTSLTIQIHARANANRLSLATMPICTNDGFTGGNGLKLPGGFKPEIYYARIYDAGTEQNNEVTTHLSDSCGGIGPYPFPPTGTNLRIPENERIRHHPGILGVGDLMPELHGWSDPVMRITVRRVR